MTVPMYPANSYIVSMPELPIQKSRVETDYTVTTHDLNQYDMIHGGRLLTLADETGYLSAYRICQAPCVTRAVHQVQFLHPAPLHARLRCMAQTVWTGKRSLWTCITIDWQQQIIMDALFVFVLTSGKITLPRLVAHTAHERAQQHRCRNLYEHQTSSHRAKKKRP